MMCAMDARNMLSELAVNKYLHTVASCWILLIHQNFQLQDNLHAQTINVRIYTLLSVCLRTTVLSEGLALDLRSVCLITNIYIILHNVLLLTCSIYYIFLYVCIYGTLHTISYHII